MTPDEAIVHPVRTRRSPTLGPTAILVATEGDTDLLSRSLALPDTSALYMSRIHHDKGALDQPAVVGPFMGAPYAVMLLEVLRAWGVQKVFFFGWCGSIHPRVRTGDLIVPTGACIDEGTSPHYGQTPDGIVPADDALRGLLRAGLARRNTPFHDGLIWTTDAIFRETPDQIDKYSRLGALAVEMELSALLSTACFYNLQLAALLAVSDELFTGRWRPGFRSDLFKQARMVARDLLIKASAPHLQESEEKEAEVKHED